MPIPRIIHQLWKNETIPVRWQPAVRSVQRYHKGWEYRLWTDELIDRHVRVNHPAFYKVFAGLNRQIMRVDVFRYVLMNDFGGLYCDLDYEFLRPFDYSNDEVVLSLEYDVAYGDDHDQVANYVLASAPGHQLWNDLLTSIATNPPHTPTESDVCIATGPWFVTRIYNGNASRYTGVRLTPKPVLSPRRVHGRYERKIYVNSGITYGFHHGWGSWRNRVSWTHLKRRVLKTLGVKMPPERTLPLPD